MSPALTVALDVTLVLLSIVMLWKGADAFVDSAIRIARRFEISDLVIGITLVGFATSAPEFAVSIRAAITQHGDISVGNVVGSNIFNLGFILGGCAAIRPIVTTQKMVFRDGVFLIAVTLILTFFAWDLTLERWEGIVLMVLLASYLTLLFVRREPLEDIDHDDGPATWKDGLMLFVGLATIVGGSELLVYSASGIARVFGLSEWTIAVTIVAAGTSAPELVTSLNAAFKGRYGISAGNLIGSDLFNLLGVLGLAAFIRPMTVDAAARSSLQLLVLMVCVVVLFMRSGWKISRLEGGLLVGVNLVRWIFDMASGKTPEH